MKVNTIHGEMEESELEKRVGPGFVEYHLNGVLVHRSASAVLAPTFPMVGKLQQFAPDHVPAPGTNFKRYGLDWTFGAEASFEKDGVEFTAKEPQR